MSFIALYVNTAPIARKMKNEETSTIQIDSACYSRLFTYKSKMRMQQNNSVQTIGQIIVYLILDFVK